MVRFIAAFLDGFEMQVLESSSLEVYPDHPTWVVERLDGDAEAVLP
jgi:hypothetical protein